FYLRRFILQCCLEPHLFASIVLLSTHIVSDIEHIADDILMMKSGQLIYQGKWTDKSGNLEEFYLKQFEEIE
ncbi:MAG: hypothetical protein ACLS56_02060, partial [Gemmiger formicilis]